MSIISSLIVEDIPQRGGRRAITENHTDNIGKVYIIQYLAPDLAWDANAALTARAVSLAADIAAVEAAANVSRIMLDGRLAVVSFAYTTVAATVAGMREDYRNATKEQAAYMGDFFASLTDAQLQTAFGFTAAQVTALRTSKFTPATTLVTSIRATTGQ